MVWKILISFTLTQTRFFFNPLAFYNSSIEVGIERVSYQYPTTSASLFVSYTSPDTSFLSVKGCINFYPRSFIYPPNFSFGFAMWIPETGETKTGLFAGIGGHKILLNRIIVSSQGIVFFLKEPFTAMKDIENLPYTPEKENKVYFSLKFFVGYVF